jgi:hypothetical protein
MSTENHQINSIVDRNFHILTESEEEELDEEQLHLALAARIADMLEHEIDLLLSTLYRLDVFESKIKHVLSGRTGEGVAEGLARLVIERQKEKIESRRRYAEKEQQED